MCFSSEKSKILQSEGDVRI